MYESFVFLSEIVLSLYPILIKSTDASVGVQTGFRMYVFAICAMIVSLVQKQNLLDLSLSNIFGSGLLNLMHVGASYKAFELLPAGNAMALFYTYPVMNLLGSSLVYGEKIKPEVYGWILLALGGAFLLAQPSANPKEWNKLGILLALVAAATETGIYLLFKQLKPEENSFKQMFSMYGGSAILWTLMALFGLLSFSGSLTKKAISIMVLFNVLIGFVGYGARFFAIPKVSTTVFSAISFFGIISAYIFGWIFEGETVNYMSALGALAIMIANIVLVREAEK
jgi:drug/metabolite transporter (DMT)-like permease